MAELYFYNEDASSLTVTLDSGQVCAGVRAIHKGRNCFVVILPDTATGGVTVETPGYAWNTAQRGLLVLPSDGNPEFTFALDDIRGSSVPTPPDHPPPSYHGSPEDIVNQVYQQGSFNLSTKDGCGKFTEACCTALHDNNDPMWGHIKKTGGQNQYNKHAVDALMLLTGDNCGVYDIIHDSESPNATPSYNYKGEPDNSLWYYPA